MVLSTSVDATYADDGSDASVKQHQQDHDTVHGAVNALAGGTAGQVWQKTGSADYAASWATPGFGGGDYFASGYYSAGVFASSTGTGSLTTNEVYFRPFLVPTRRAFDRIGIQVSTAAAAGGVLRMGIYRPGAGAPGTLLVDAGTISSTTTGAKEIAITQTLDAGVWWLAVVAQSAGCGVYTYPASNHTPYISFSSSPTVGALASHWSQSGVSGALPTTPTLATDGIFAAVSLRAA